MIPRLALAYLGDRAGRATRQCEAADTTSEHSCRVALIGGMAARCGGGRQPTPLVALAVAVGRVLLFGPAITESSAACIALRALSEHFRAIVRVQSPIRLADQSEPQPDLVLLRYRPDFYRDAHPGPNDVLLAIEVADTSAAYDREVKVPLYGRAGSPEVWLIDLVAATFEVYTHPSRQGYDHHVRLVPGDRLRCESLPDLEVAVSDLLS